MKISNSNSRRLHLFLALLLSASTSQAEIYKWVDANGRTHYSEKKEEADQARASELKVKPRAPSAEETNASRQYWQEQERLFKERQEQRGLEQRRLNQQTHVPRTATAPRSLSGGKDDGTDASKCNLARDILSGAVKLRSGAPTGDYERATAENDVRLFCR